MRSFFEKCDAMRLRERTARALAMMMALAVGGCCFPGACPPRPPKNLPGQEAPNGGPVIPKTKAKKVELQYLLPLTEGKPGFYYAPDDRAKRPIDGRGFPPGTEILSPYSHKVYLVPTPVKAKSGQR
jgi:hypothetical protein